MRWQIALAVVCLVLAAALLAVQQPAEPEAEPVATLVVVESGTCTMVVAAPGGVLSEGLVGAPQYPNPLLADANPVDAQLVALIFDGLTRYNVQGELEPALAESWIVSEDGTRVTFTLREDARWHDGEPVTAADVIFTYSLLQADDFPGESGLQRAWQPVQMTATGVRTVEFVLPQSYSPFMELTTRGILPAHLLQNVASADLTTTPFNAAPVGTGPFRVTAGSNWARDGFLRLEANPDLWEMALDAIDMRFYTDDTALIDAYTAGEIQAMTTVSREVLPAVAALPGMRLYTSAEPRYAQVLFNVNAFQPTVTADSRVREAVALALDRAALITGTLNGQGLPLDGPYLPTSLAYRPGVTAYSPDSAVAGQLLDEAGWPWTPGSATRVQSADSETPIPLNLRLITPDTAVHNALGASIVASLREIGVGVTLTALSSEELATALQNRAFELALVDVRPPADPDLYDFWSQEAIVRGQNYAGWNARQASEALESGRQLWPLEERQQAYGEFLKWYDQAVPALTLLQYVSSYGLSDVVNSAEIGLINTPRDRYKTLADWTIATREVAVDCPNQ